MPAKRLPIVAENVIEPDKHFAIALGPEGAANVCRG
jgi:hypothetical protein